MVDAKKTIMELLSAADIQVNGSRPWDIQVHNEQLYANALHHGTIGIGEAYMKGWWDCRQMDEMFYRALRIGADHTFSYRNLPGILLGCYQSLRNLQSRKRSFEVAEVHYNFGNDMFAHMLGPSMNYSCAYWKDANSLDEAQEAKMALVCKKLQLQPGMTVLDIGCGWGAMGDYMIRKYGVKLTGVSVSKEQIAYAREAFPSGTWLLDDYRNLDGQYDRIVSIGMFEHVGYKNYPEFMAKAHSLLKPDGLFLLHTIGTNEQRKGTDPWINKYIFPNGMVPSQTNVSKAASPYFIMEDWHNFGPDYDRTLMAWNERFEEGCRENKFAHTETTKRMFRYYLLSCAAAFRIRSLQLWQIMLSPHGVPGGYASVR